MTLRRRILDYSLAVLLLALPAVIFHVNLKAPEAQNGFDRAVLRISSPLQAAVSWVVGGIGGLWNRYVWLVDVDEENRELRGEVRRLRRELSEAQRKAGDVEALEALVGLKQKTSAETLGARVIASSINPHFRVVRIRIDRGEADLAPGMPVVVTDGLVGRIHHVYGDYADVLLITDPQSSIDTVIPRTGGRGVLTGLGRDDAYRAKIEYLERDHQVKVGDEVVTSGLGGAFPAGLAVGKIAKVKKVEYGLYQKVEVEPTVDFSSLSHVLVLAAPPPPPDPGADTPKRSPPARGVRPF